MTPIKPSRKLGVWPQRETGVEVRARGSRFAALAVELHGGYLTIWPKGFRSQKTSVSYETIWRDGLCRDAGLSPRWVKKTESKKAKNKKG